MLAKKIRTFFWELKRPIPLDNDFDNYDDYWKNRGFHAPASRRARIISPHINNNSSILDVGCGDGALMKYLSENNNPREVTGVDISSKAIKYVQKQGMQGVRYDVLSKDFKKYMKGKQFDYMIITEVLEHIQDSERVLEVLKPHVKKAIFVSIPNAGFFVNRVRFLFGRFPLVMIQQHVKEHIRFWTLHDFKYWSNFLGFEVDKVLISSGLGIKVLRPVERIRPSLFADQLIYIIIPKANKK